MPLFDTHCHLDDPRLAEQIDEVMARAAEAGVARMATIGCVRELENVRSALDVAAKYPDRVVATCGVHPHDAAAWNDGLGDAVAATCADDAVVAIGEMGLDYYYDNSPREVQGEVFRQQIALGKKLGKPLVVHTRDAGDETLAILREEGARDVGGIIHCFSEDPDFARAAMDLDFVISFSGIVTFKSAKGVQETAKIVPLDRMLVETDAPYLAPVPKRGKRNEPAYVAHTAAKIAELRGESLDVILEATWANAHRVFGLEAP